MSERVEFDREDVEMLRGVSCCPSHEEACAERADYIESLLPPTDTTDSAVKERDHTAENRQAILDYERLAGE
jgi:hypothetical protein